MERELKRLARAGGADAVGIAAVDRLADAPPSADASYLLAGARSVISLMVALDDGVVERYLAKEDRGAMQRHELERYVRLHAVARSVTRLLREAGHRVALTEPNLDYRYKRKAAYNAVPPAARQRALDWLASDHTGAAGLLKGAMLSRVPDALLNPGFRLTPTFAHRYGAVAAGIGALGWSGNVLHPSHGARVFYHSVITDAVLAPDPMLEQSPCDGCRLCTKVCQGGFMDQREEDGVTIGGRRMVHSQRAHNLRCVFICGGLSGQSRDSRWSTWSSGRVRLPDDDDALPGLWQRMARASLGTRNHYSRTLADLQYHSDHGYSSRRQDRFKVTCGFCQHVCAPTRQRRKALYKVIVASGCVPAVPPPF